MQRVSTVRNIHETVFPGSDSKQSRDSTAHPKANQLIQRRLGETKSIDGSIGVKIGLASRSASKVSGRGSRKEPPNNIIQSKDLC